MLATRTSLCRNCTATISPSVKIEPVEADQLQTLSALWPEAPQKQQ